VTTYPYQVIRARLQDQDSRHTRTIACIKDTLRYEGVRGLYKGLTPYLVHVLPNICMVFLIYEKMTAHHQQQQAAVAGGGGAGAAAAAVAAATAKPPERTACKVATAERPPVHT
jgi:hypothetical protein